MISVVQRKTNLSARTRPCLVYDENHVCWCLPFVLISILVFVSFFLDNDDLIADFKRVLFFEQFIIDHQYSLCPEKYSSSNSKQDRQNAKKQSYLHTRIPALDSIWLWSFLLQTRSIRLKPMAETIGSKPTNMPIADLLSSHEQKWISMVKFPPITQNYRILM